MDTQTTSSEHVLSEAEQQAILYRERLETAYSHITFPSLLARIKAIFVDFAVMLLVFTLASWLIDLVGDIPNAIRGGILIFMVYLYDPLLTSFYGGTLGHQLIGLKVKRYRNPEMNLSLPIAFLRFFIKASLGFISFFTVTGTERKQAIHDMICDSIVLPKKEQISTT